MDTSRWRSELEINACRNASEHRKRKRTRPDCSVRFETRRSRQKCEEPPQSRLFIVKTPDHPFSEDLLELAHLAGVPIPKELGTTMIHMLKENVAPLGIRTILHRVLQNCQTKRLPQGKLRNLSAKDVVSGCNLNDDDSGDDISDYPDADRPTSVPEYSTATRYLIENSRLIVDPSSAASDGDDVEVSGDDDTDYTDWKSHQPR